MIIVWCYRPSTVFGVLGVFGSRFEGVWSPASFLILRIMPSNRRRSSCSDWTG